MKKREQTIDPIEKDFLDAIERIKAGKPKDDSLKAKAKQGKLKLSASSVAIEAGHSRTLIGHGGCRYPEVRGLLLEKKKRPDCDDLQEIERLRATVQELRRKLAAAMDQNAILLASKL